AREEAAAVSARAREEVAGAAAQRDALAAELAEARRGGDAARARLTETEVRLRAAEADRDSAQRRAAQLADQVSDLAAALARLGAPPQAG
ncbi:hypothetical protein V6U89_20750, partial [Micromonospora sp. CPCC 206171]